MHCQNANACCRDDDDS